MNHSISQVPFPSNEPILSYASGSDEKQEVLEMYRKMYKSSIDIPMRIGNREVRSGIIANMSPPHDHKHSLGTYHKAETKHIKEAIEASLKAKKAWSKIRWESRASIFLKAAELVAGPYRAKINAATMLAQSKTIHQAEIDAACECIDFLRFNAYFMQEIYENQPENSHGIWNRIS